MQAFLVSTFVVALAEIGDKTQLLAILLATRFRRPWPIIGGILVATLANHALAATVGYLVSDLLGGLWFRLAVGLSFIAMAIWALVPDKEDDEAVKARGKPGLIVLNQAPSRRGGIEPPIIHKAVEAAYRLGLPIAAVGLRARVAFQDSLWRGEGVLEFDARSAAAEEVRRLWNEVAGLLDAGAVRPPRAALA